MPETEPQGAGGERVDYDSIAARFDRRYAENDYRGVERALLSFAGQPGAELLEVGCGTGHWLALLHSHGFRPAGVEPAAEMIRHAGSKETGGRLARACAEALPFADRVFDGVFGINALHHFADAPAFLAEAHRVLRRGGGVLVIGLDPHGGGDRWWIYDYFPEVADIDRRRYPPAERLRAWMQAAGFEGCVTREALHLPVSLDARQALAGGRLDKSSTSQLALLSDERYEEGMRQLRRDIEAAASRGETLAVGADLRLWATSARAI
jgi:ubiquinone/menaquinone biosynthesis C-methylase UbiE